MLNNAITTQSVISQFDTTKKSAPLSFRIRAGEIVKKFLDINIATTPAEYKAVQKTLKAAEAQRDIDNSKYEKTWGAVDRVHLVDVLIAGFRIPGFDWDLFVKYMAIIKSGGSASYICFQRLYNAVRELSDKYINQLWAIEKAGFNFNKLQPIVVWYDKKRKQFLVLDGGHTLIMCLIHGMSSAKEVIVVFADTIQEAVENYTNQYQCTTRLDGLQTIIGGYVQGDEACVNVIDTLYNAGVNFDGYAVDEEVATVKCFTLLKKIYTDHGQAGLDFVINVPKSIWGIKDKKVTDKSLIMVLGQVFDKCQVDEKSFDDLYDAMSAYDSAQEFMDGARKYILDNDIKAIGGKTNEGPITTFCRIVTGISKAQKK